MNTPVPHQALEAFSSRLPRGGSVLCADPEVATWLSLRGLQITPLAPEKDLRLLSLKRESNDGIWAGAAFAAFPIEDAQRVIAAFFQALRPGSGVLFASHSYDETAFASLLRQNGFEIRLSGQFANRHAVVSQRI